MDVCPNCTGSGTQLDVDYPGPGFRREPCSLCGGDGEREQEPAPMIPANYYSTAEGADEINVYRERSTVVFGPSMSNVDGAYVGSVIELDGEIRRVTRYDGSSRTATFAPPFIMSPDPERVRVYTSAAEVERDFGAADEAGDVASAYMYSVREMFGQPTTVETVIDDVMRASRIVRAETNAAYLAAGVVTPDEVRESRFLSPEEVSFSERQLEELNPAVAYEVVENVYRATPPSPELEQMYADVQEIVDRGNSPADAATMLMMWATQRQVEGVRSQVGVVDNVPVNTPIIAVRVDVPEGVPTSAGMMTRGLLWMEAGETLRPGDAVSVDDRGRAVRVRSESEFADYPAARADDRVDALRYPSYSYSAGEIATAVIDAAAIASGAITAEGLARAGNPGAGARMSYGAPLPLQPAEGEALNRLAREVGIERGTMVSLAGLPPIPESDADLRVRIIERYRANRQSAKSMNFGYPGGMGATTVQCRCVLVSHDYVDQSECRAHGPVPLAQWQVDKWACTFRERIVEGADAFAMSYAPATRANRTRQIVLDGWAALDRLPADVLRLASRVLVLADNLDDFDIERSTLDVGRFAAITHDGRRAYAVKDRYGNLPVVASNSRDRRRWRVGFATASRIAEDAIREQDRAGAVAALADYLPLDVAIELTQQPAGFADLKWKTLEPVAGRLNMSAPPMQNIPRARTGGVMVRYPRSVAYMDGIAGMGEGSADDRQASMPRNFGVQAAAARGSMAQMLGRLVRNPAPQTNTLRDGHPLRYLAMWARARRAR